MDDGKLIGRLEALRPPEVEPSRRRALATVPGRVTQLRSSTRPARRRPLLFGIAVAALVAAIVLVVSLENPGPAGPTRAYGAEAVRFAESTPLLLLESPGWRVQHVGQQRLRVGSDGSMEFVTGKPIPYETIEITGSPKREHESGMSAPAVRQRRVELSWRSEPLGKAIARQREGLHPRGERWVKMPVLGTTAEVDTRASFYVNQGGPGNREMKAFWSEGGWTLTLEAAVPDQAAFAERLDWLTKVDSKTWLDAMPAAVVKATDIRGTVEEMIKGIPLPKTFAISRVPDEQLTTNREVIGFQVAGTISCLWLRQWSAARNSGDLPSEREAEQAMATSHHWKILTDVEPTAGYPETVWGDAAGMKTGYWEMYGFKRKLIPQAEGLGCARFGLPLMTKKIERQKERGVPPPPE